MGSPGFFTLFIDNIRKLELLLCFSSNESSLQQFSFAKMLLFKDKIQSE